MTPSAADIEAWLVARVSGLTGVPAADIDTREPLTRYGLDSVSLIALAAEMEKRTGYRFRENPLDAHSTIESLARFVAGRVAPPGPGG